MFLHLSVILFRVGGGGGCLPLGPGGVCLWAEGVSSSGSRGSASGWGCTHPGRHPLGRHTPHPRETATAADGTHPTGMHSCNI